MTREKAQEILNQYVKNDSLRRHCLAVAISMEYFARKFCQDVNKWYVTGLLHDFDYEKHPDKHPMIGEEILRDLGCDEEIIRAIQSHANYTDISRDSLMEKALFAVDELSGFVVAVALVRPEKMAGMKVKSVKNKLKDRGFASGVNREDVYDGAEGLGIELDDLIQGVIDALCGEAKKLDLS